MCSSGGGGYSEPAGATKTATGSPDFNIFGESGGGSTPANDAEAAAAEAAARRAPVNNEVPTENGTETRRDRGQSSLSIRRTRGRGSGTASTPAGGSGLNIPT